VPDEYLGSVLKLCQDRRGEQVELTYAGNRAMVVYRPAAERSGVRLLRPAEVVSRGYASFDYQIDGYERATW
jgi:GTP-binding protein LepA